MSNLLLSNFDHFQVATLDGDLYPKGQETAPDSVANGTTTSAYLYSQPVSFSEGGVEISTVEGQGGGYVWAKQDVGISTIGNGSLSLSGHDDSLKALLQGASVDTTTNTNHRARAANKTQVNLPRMFSIFTVRATTADGDTVYHNVFVLNAQYRENQGEIAQGSGTNPANADFTMTTNLSKRNAYSQLWSASANLSVENDRDTTHYIESQNPLALTVYVDDGIATTFNLGYQPATDTVGRHYFYKNGVDASGDVSGITTSSGEVTITAGTAGDIWVALYETNFLATA